MDIKKQRWVKHITSLISQSQEFPMWGAFPSFPWEEFSTKLKDLLNLKNLSITPGLAEWKKEGSVLKEMGNSPLQIGVLLSPIEGSLSLVFPSENFSKLSSWAIHSNASEIGFSDPYLQKGFFRFLALEALNLTSNLEMFSRLSPKLTDLPLPSGDAYCVDIAIEHEKETVWGRLIFSSLFHSSFRSRLNAEWQLSIPSHLYSDIFLSLSLSPGQVSLSQDAFTKLSNGDFLLLDYSSYSPTTKKGTFQLLLENTPLFQTKLKEENIKILDYAVYHEESKMNDEDFDESYQEEEYEEGEEEKASKESANSPTEEIISPKEIPITLSVEIAKLKMSLEKLLELKPGNILDLHVHPESGVNLVTSGKCVAQGDLVQIGDVIGVKIKKIGLS